MKHFRIIIGVLLVNLLLSCSDSSYLNPVPAESKALIAINPAKMSGIDNVIVLKSLLHLKKLDKTGIDLSQRILLFESPDGNLGACMKMRDKDDFLKTLDNLNEQGVCSKVQSFRDYNFAVLRDSWLVGYSDKSLLIMGPVTVSGQSQMRQQMVKYLNQDEDEGILSSKIYEKIDSLEAPMCMVARADALPEQLVAPLTIGIPKGADASRVYICANVEKHGECLFFDGKPFAFNRKVNESLQNALAIYRPIKGTYANTMHPEDAIGIFMDVNGEAYLPVLQNNKGFQVLLSGINSAIDMNNILRSIDGEMTLIGRNDKASQGISLVAQLAHTKWLADVDYWKQSCPAGSSIVDWQKDAFHFSDGKADFYFGVTPDKQFYSGSTPEKALSTIANQENRPTRNDQQLFAGQRFVMMVNLNHIGTEKGNMVGDFISPIFGKVSQLVYRIK
ncbi:DUF4836 family protein [Prevotella sp. S7 MS 2]|uniref:DUF4836 family protein n=1 Tax=Prevotella sp. S7 MS 2 TaxID=1287488 RepID=UPI000513BAEC|nr:DUF4836 family protein [Prevotella sp. S7 MS 2]KGI59804.1 hypothetical protein HMPREF0671_09535 [Prevotella sp. S7 MS 2]